MCPQLVAEAFIVGLMLDCGQPLMSRLVGPSYLSLRSSQESPTKLFTAEFGTLEYTHVDVAAGMMRLWKMPGLLARPITWHHSLPQAGKTSDAAAMLQRLAYYVGAVQLSPAGVPTQSAPLPSMANRLFEIDSADLTDLIAKATAEYRSTIELFSDVGDPVGGVESIAEAVQAQLIVLMDEQLGRALHAETRGGPQKMVVSGQNIEIEPGKDGDVIAIISGSDGTPIISCTVKPATDGPDVLCSRLGLEGVDAHEMDGLMTAVRAMAA
jgi:hypothetical protein